jgi:hypothetical protein
MKTIKYFDYDQEGLFAYELSQTESKNPLLICVLEFDEGHYRLWDEDTYEPMDEVWFHKETSQLNELHRFKVKIYLNELTYVIYEVIDQQAYLNIWTMASHDYGIATYTVSGECDLDTIIDELKSSEFYADEDFDCSKAPWVYTQRYGGGSDEHHAVFYCTNKKNLEFIKEQLDHNDIATFE